MATDKGTSLMKDLLSYVVFRIDFFPLQHVYSKNVTALFLYKKGLRLAGLFLEREVGGGVCILLS